MSRDKVGFVRFILRIMWDILPRGGTMMRERKVQANVTFYVDMDITG